MGKNEKNCKISVLEFARTMAGIGCIGFGGGNALIPIIQEKAVEEQKLLSEEEYEEEVLVASVTPGALPVEIAGGIGHIVFGAPGTVIGSYAMATPGVLLTLLFLILNEWISETILHQVKFFEVGVSAFICVLLSSYIKETLRRERTDGHRLRYVLVILCVFIITCEKNLYRFLGIKAIPLFGIATIDVFIAAIFLILMKSSTVAKPFRYTSLPIAIIFVAVKGKFLSQFELVAYIKLIVYALIICLSMYALTNIAMSVSKMSGQESRDNRNKDIILLLIITITIMLISVAVCDKSILFLGKGLLSSLISFGGGDAYLTVADGLFVDGGLIEESEFYGTIVPIVNLLPGSILCKTLSSIGFYIGNGNGSILVGMICALLGFSVSVLASCGIFSFIHAFYGQISAIPTMKFVKEWIRPIISGLMINVILSIAYQAKQTNPDCGGWRYVIILFFLAAFGDCLYRRRMANFKIICIVSSVALMVCNVISIL